MRTAKKNSKPEQKNRLIAKRTLTGSRDGQTARVTITLLLPATTSHSYTCELRYSGSFNNTKIVKGKDLLDSIQGALVYIAADLFAFTRETGISLAWKDAIDGVSATVAGFSSFPDLQLMVLPPAPFAPPGSV